MNKLDALIFDLDGTLCDTIEANVASYRLAFDKEGVLFNESAFRDNFGLRFEEMVEVISPSVESNVRDKIAQSKSVFYEGHTHLVVPNTDLINTMLFAKSIGIKIGLATTAKRKNAEMILKHLRLINSFDVIIYGEDVQRGKPDPQCYKQAIDKLGTKPKKCIIFEDTEIGIAAAKATGANVIKVKI